MKKKKSYKRKNNLINEDIILKENIKKKQKKEYKETIESKKKNKVFCFFKYSFAMVFLFCIFAFLGFSYFIYVKAPEFNKDLLYKKESSNIYDSSGNLIVTIGSEKRQLVSYDMLPEVLVDAIIATEDARFFEHNGLDLPRFLKASAGFIKGDDAGGASTITMQISKNTFTSTKSKGFDGIVRKFTDIYMSIFKIEEDYSKNEILEFYVNAPYLGAGSYGVMQASQTYFNKSISDITLVEAAFLAGLFQAPGEYDPYVNPDKAYKRKNEVLSLMLRHGYISEEEYNISKEVKIENIIVEKNESLSPYQGFVDTVVQEVIDRTGDNPYEVSMDIYSTMIKEKQDVINKFYKTYKFKDGKVQVGIGVIDNDSGAIIAVGAGRNKVSEMSFNYATQIKRHPGSTAKPIFDYGPGIEYLNWSTYTPFVDKPVRYTNGGVLRNVDGNYQGFLTLEECLVRSRNTCALQAFQKLKNSKIDKFVTSLGITPEYLGRNRFINEAHSIGGFTGVSPVELAAAYSSFGNGGYFTEPHSYVKIVYKNENKDIVLNPEYKKNKVMKETTAYLISYMLEKATNYRIKVKGTDIAAKTGTSSYDENALKKLGLTNSVIQDSWTVSYSPDYSIAIWYGYDNLSKKYYNTTSHAMVERFKIQEKIVNKIMEKNSKFVKPSGIVASKVEVGSSPAKLPSASTPSSKIQTHLFIKGTQPKTISNSYKVKEETVTDEKEDNSEISNIPSILFP